MKQSMLTCYKTFIQLLEIEGNFVQFSQSDLDIFQHGTLLLLQRKEPDINRL